MFKRWMSAFLALVLIVGMVPVNVWAEEPRTVETTETIRETEETLPADTTQETTEEVTEATLPPETEPPVTEETAPETTAEETVPATTETPEPEAATGTTEPEVTMEATEPVAEQKDAASSEEEAMEAASGTCGENLTWTLENGVLTISGTGPMKDYSGGHISPWYDKRESITSIVIEEGVTTIGNYAFHQCAAFITLTLPESITYIGEAAFRYCHGLLLVKLGSKVTEIAREAFSGCENLGGIHLPEGLTTLGNSAFYQCKKLTDLEIPTTVTTIGNAAFMQCQSLTSVVVPEGVTELGNQVFSGCSKLTDVTLPEGLTKIGMEAFDSCTALEEIEIPEGVVTIAGSAFDYCKALLRVKLPSTLKEIYGSAFRYCFYMEEINLPEGLTHIGNYAFDSCRGLTSITIPSTVTTIEEYAFVRCEGIVDVEIPAGVSTLGAGVFAGCSKLKTIRVAAQNPNYESVDGILYNEDLTELVACPPALSGNITVPNGVTTIGNGTFSGCSNITGVTLGSGVTTIGDEAFYNCSKLKLLVIPDSVTAIGERAFYGYNKINKVIFLGDPPAIAETAFQYATVDVCYDPNNPEWTEDIRMNYGGTLNWLPYTAAGTCGEAQSWVLDAEGCLSIFGSGAMADYSAGEAPWYAFREQITAISMQENITSIGDNAFRGLSNLRDMTVIAGIRAIGSGAFAQCTGLERVTFQGDAPSLEKDSFADVTADVLFLEGSGWTESVCQSYGGKLTWIGYLYTGSCGENVIWYLDSTGCVTVSGTGEMNTRIPREHSSRVTSVVMDDEVTSVVGYAFDGFRNLTSAAFGNSIRTIEQCAFISTGLTSLTLPDSVESIGFNAFAFTPLESITFQGSAPEFAANTFNGVTAAVKYPSTADWTLDDFQNYGGTLTWEPYAVSLGDGACGEDLTWEVNVEGTLTLSGTGPMASYTQGEAPWSGYASRITTVILPEGMTAIGSYAFADCANISNVRIPASVTAIGSGAFSGCTGLKTLAFLGTPSNIAGDSFASVTARVFYSGEDSWAGTAGKNYGGTLEWISGAARGTCGESLFWLLDEDGLLTISGFGDMTDYASASEAPWYRLRKQIRTVVIEEGVTSVGSYAFANSYLQITAVTLPSTLRIVGNNAFYRTSALTEIDLPEGLREIRDSAFRYSGLTSVTIPHTILSLGEYAFSNCQSLAELALGSRVRTIGRYCFSNCVSLEYVWFPESVKEIKSSAFYGCRKLTEIEFAAAARNPMVRGGFEEEEEDFGTGIKKGLYIESSAFSRCDLTNVYLPEILAEIHYSCFGDNLQMEGIWADTEPMDGKGFFYRSDEFGCLYRYNSGAAEPSALMCVPEQLRGEYRIPDSVTYVYPNFRNCVNLTKLYFGANCAGINGTNVFKGCTSLEAVQAGTNEEGAREIFYNDENGVFYCESSTACYLIFVPPTVKTFTLPAKVTDISTAAFCNTSLPEIRVEKGSKTYSSVDGVLYSADGETLVRYPTGKTEATVLIPKTVRELGSYAFAHCTNVREIKFQGDYVDFASDSFLGITATCHYPEDLWDPDVLGELGYVVESGGGNITWVPYTSDGKPITSGSCGENVTWNYSDDGVLTIQGEGNMKHFNMGFAPWSRYADKIVSVVIGNGVTRIGNYAFAEHTALQNITFLGNAPRISDTAFLKVIATVTYPGGNMTWGEEELRDYGGELTWVTADHVPEKKTIPAKSATDKAYGNKAFSVTCCKTCGVWLTENGAQMTEEEIQALYEENRVYAKARSVKITLEDGGALPKSVDLSEAVSLRLKATVVPATAKQTVTWKSSKTKVADFDESGALVLKANGSTTITATGPDKRSASVTVTVVTGATGLTVPEFVEVGIGKTASVTTELQPATVSSKTLKWTVDEAYRSWVTISSGKITVKKNFPVPEAGYTPVPVEVETTDGSNISRTVEIRVRPLTSKVLLSRVTEEGTSDVTGKTLTLGMDEGLTLTGGIQPENAVQGVTWKSSSTKIATVKDGVVEPVKPGSVTITATAADGSGKKATVKVNVVRYVEEVALSGNTAIAGGKSLQLKAAITPGNATKKTLSWTLVDCPNKNVKISASGKLTTPKVTEQLTVTVRAAATDGSGRQDTHTLTIYPAATSVTLYDAQNEKAGSSQTLGIGETLVLKAQVAPQADGTEPETKGACPDVIWSSSKEKVARVENGLITPVGTGTATITATAADGSGKKDSITIKVVRYVESLKITGKTYVAGGKSLQLAASVTPGNASNKSVSWTLVDCANKKVKLSASGKLTTPKVTEQLEVTVRAVTKDGTEIPDTRTVTIYPAATSVTLYDAQNEKAGKTRKLGLDDTLQLTALVAPHVGSVEPDTKAACQEVTWKSSSTKIATVENGLVTPKKTGTATITAAAADGSGKTATVKITVTAAATTLKLTASRETIPLGLDARLTATVNKGAILDAVYTSSDEQVAVVSETGVITPVGVGSASITATNYNGISDSVEIQVTPEPTEVFLKEGEVTLGVKETRKLEPVTDFAQEIPLTYKSSNSKVVTVDSAGKLTGKKAGTATITISAYNGKTAQCQVTVAKAPGSIKLSSEKLSLSPGQQSQLEYTLSKESAGAVSWSSSNSKAVTVSQTGTVQAVAPGTAKITARTFNGKTATCSVKVHSQENAIHDLKVEDGHVVANVTTDRACRLVVEVWYEKSPEEAVTAREEIAEAVQKADIASLEVDSGEYFLLKAVLEDSKGNPLCGEFVSRKYTSEYHQSVNAKPEDYPGHETLDFGEAGFAVLAEGVRVVSGTSIGDNRYAINVGVSRQKIRPGDALILAGTNEPVMVGSLVQNVDGILTVIKDTTACMEDFYEVFNVDGYSENAENAYLELPMPHISNSVEGFDGLATFSVDMDSSLGICIHFNKRLKVEEVSIRLGTTGTASIGAKGELDTDNLPIPLVIPIYGGEIPVGLTGVKIDASALALKLRMRAEAFCGFTAELTTETIVSYDWENGARISAGELSGVKLLEENLEIEGEVTATFGPHVGLGVKIPDLLDVGVSGDVVARFKATGEITSKDAEKEAIATKASSYHACDLCFTTTFDIYASVEADFEVEFLKIVKIAPWNTKLDCVVSDLEEDYISVINEPESVHKGEKKVGFFQKCPNHRYRTEIQTVDYRNKVTTGKTVTLTGDHMTAKDSQQYPASSTAVSYLYPGSYTASALFENVDKPVTKDFTIVKSAQTVSLKEPSAEMYGGVEDAETGKGIPGARVMAVRRGVSTDQVYTDEKGMFHFESLIPGEYLFYFSAEGYEPQEEVPITLEEGNKNQCIAYLEPVEKLPILKATSRNNTAQALTESGELPEGAPVVMVSTVADKGGGIYSMTLSSPGCESVAIRPGFNIYDVSVFGVNMGDGEYTFGMSLTVNGRMGGEANYIFKIVDGEIRILKCFEMGSKRSDNIYVSATFSSSNKFSGTIYPTEVKFTAYSYRDSSEQIGKKVFENGTGLLDYEENEDGTYSMIFTTIERCVDNSNGVGNSFTRYVLKGDDVVIDKQWYRGSGDK